MSSSTSKRRKVTVDIKQTKLDRGSVFERLGTQEKRKKGKESSDGKVRPKKSNTKMEEESTEQKKKTKSSKSDQNVSSKKSKEYSSNSKTKSGYDDIKETRKSHKHYDETEMVMTSETGRTHSKHKGDREGKGQKLENLIIEKRVSISTSSRDQSRSVSPSYSPRKKSKKRPSKHSSQERSLERYQQDPSPSPEPPKESYRQKERGRSREPKKKSKDGARKSKVEVYEEEIIYHVPKVTKVKKSSKHVKNEKGYDDVSIPEKKHKIKHTSINKDVAEKTRMKSSTAVYEESSDERYRKTDNKSEERGKAKRRKFENDLLDESPVRHKKSKRQLSVELETRESRDHALKTREPAMSHTSKKRSHKEEESMSKKRVQKQEPIQENYSDYSSPSKQSIQEYSEISQESEANEERYSTDSYERESKKRAKAKKKAKKEPEISKVRYEVIDADDGHSDDAKKTKKRKRKREDMDPPFIESPIKEGPRHHEKERRQENIPRESIPPKKKNDSKKWTPHDDTRRSEKNVNIKHDDYERKSSHDRGHSSQVIKTDIRSPEVKYFDNRKNSHESRKDNFNEPVQTRDGRYSPDRRGYTEPEMDSRHLSNERINENKVSEWQKKSSKHFTERKESVPRHLPPPNTMDRREEHPRQHGKFPQQRKLLEPEYIFSEQPEFHRTGRSLERRGRGNDRQHIRPPPLLTPFFYRGRSRGRGLTPHVLRGRDRMVGGDRRNDNRDQSRGRDPHQQSDNNDHKLQTLRDNNDRRVRSGSRDSRTSLRNTSQDSRARQQVRGDLQSPQSDRNSSLERRKGPIPDRMKQGRDDNNQHFEKRPHRNLERAVPGNRAPEHDRSRPMKHRDVEDQRQSRPSSSHSSQDRRKSLQDQKSEPSSSRRRSKEPRTSSTKRSSDKKKDDTRTSKKTKERKKTADISDGELNELMKSDSKEKTANSVVDWNELPTSTQNEGENIKEHSSVLSKFSPANILRKTGVIMSMLPQHLIEKITKLDTENAEKEENKSESRSKTFVTGMLRNGLNVYSDERLRKRLLGYNTDYPHSLQPPFIINAKTYSASLKEYMRKTRMVEAV